MRNGWPRIGVAMESDLLVRTPSKAYVRLVRRSNDDLEAMLIRGERPSLDALTGYEYRGYNIAPFLTLLGIRKFIKAFFLTQSGVVYGCNTPVAQNGLHGPWIARPGED